MVEAELNKAIEDGDLSFLNSEASDYEKCIFLANCAHMLPEKFMIKYLASHKRISEAAFILPEKLKMTMLTFLYKAKLITFYNFLNNLPVTYLNSDENFFDEIMKLDDIYIGSKKQQEFISNQIIDNTYNETQTEQIFKYLLSKYLSTKHVSNIPFAKLFNNPTIVKLSKNPDIFKDIAKIVHKHTIAEFFEKYSLSVEQFNIIKKIIPPKRLDYPLWFWRTQPHLKNEIEEMFLKQIEKINFNKSQNISSLNHFRECVEQDGFPKYLVQAVYDKLKVCYSQDAKKETQNMINTLDWLDI